MKHLVIYNIFSRRLGNSTAGSTHSCRYDYWLTVRLEPVAGGLNGGPCECRTASSRTVRFRRRKANQNIRGHLRSLIANFCRHSLGAVRSCIRRASLSSYSAILDECRDILSREARLGPKACHRDEHADNTVNRNMLCTDMVSISTKKACMEVLTVLLGCWVELGRSSGSLSTISSASSASKSQTLLKSLSPELSIMQSRCTGRDQDRRDL